MQLSFDGIKGHEKNIERLKRLIKNDKVPHALLFYGERGIGKRLVAEAFSVSLLAEKGEFSLEDSSCRALADGFHPDFFLIEPEKKGKSAVVIKIDMIRQLETKLARLPVLSKRRVVLIDEADTMNEAAQNSLLKTLEEPLGEVIFLLVTSRRDSLLDTILSRVTPMAFCADEFRIENDEATRGVLLQIEFLRELRSISQIELFKRADELSTGSRAEIAEKLHYLQMAMRDVLALSLESNELLFVPLKEEMSTLLGIYSSEELLAMLEVTREYTHRLVSSNANEKLQIAALYLRLRQEIEED